MHQDALDLSCKDLENLLKTLKKKLTGLFSLLKRLREIHELNLLTIENTGPF